MAKRPSRMTIGTYEEGLRMIGHRAPPRTGDLKVSEAVVQLFCTTTEDGNRSYWDAEFANQHWGGLISPPALLMTWYTELYWQPEVRESNPALVIIVPLPGGDIINSRQNADILRPIRVGDRLTSHERLVAISPEKQTHLGPGHFITTVSDIYGANGDLVATMENIALRYEAKAA